MRHVIITTFAMLALVLRFVLESHRTAVTKEQSSSLRQNDDSSDGHEEKHDRATKRNAHLRDFFMSGSHERSYMTFKRWGEFEHACEWDYGWQGFDLFFRRADGTFVLECKCKETESTLQTKCYSKTGNLFGDVASLFGEVTWAKKSGDKYQRASCGTRTNSCDALTGANLLEIID